MKGVKGKFLKKLKSIHPIESLKQPRFLQTNVLNKFFDSNQNSQSSSIYREESPKGVHFNVTENKFDVFELVKDLEDEEKMEVSDEDDKENIGPLKKVKVPLLIVDKKKCNTSTLSESQRCSLPLSDLNVVCVSSAKQLDLVSIKETSIDCCFRRPDLNSGSLFDPNLLAAFEQARMEHIRAFEAVREARFEEKKIKDEEERPLKSRRMEFEDPLMEFEEKCPPGGSESVILYTTSLRGIRKTFEDCQKIRFLLDSFRILFYERDVSMHMEFREEIWRILSDRVVPPRLFVKGRYIGGADVVVGLHERGKLLQLFEGLPRDESTCPCDGCGGIRFVLCSNCNGSRKIMKDESEGALSIQCPQCNENGLIICPMCS
ncbi:hypothetical protein ACHQM5_019769 [Ranunculus cassubicifolius]